MKTTASARNNARLYTVQALYQKRIAQTSFDELKVQYHADNAGRHETDWNLFYTLIDAVKANEEIIDNKIGENSTDGNLDLINYVDLSVMKVGLAEMIECMEVPYQVIIKEYVEIAYNMGTEKGYLFVNAILEKSVEEYRPLEFQVKK